MFDMIYNAGRISISVVVIIYWLCVGKKSWAWVFTMIGYYAWILFVSVLYGASSSIVKNCILAMVYGPALVMLVDLFARANYLRSITAVRRALEILFWLNVISVILRPKGLYIAIEANQNFGYFLGMRNNTIEIILPMLGLSLIEEHLTRQSLPHTTLLTAVALLTFMVSKSMNAVLCMVFLLAYILFIYHGKTLRILNIWFYFIVSAVVTFLLTVLNIQQRFEHFVTSVLKKSVTLTGRSRIWESALPYIRRKWFIGYGVESEAVKSSKIHAVNSCHNYFLDFLYYGGIILMLLIIVLLIITTVRLYRENDSKTAEALGLIFGAYFILWLATPIHRMTICYMFLFWFAAYRCGAKVEFKIRAAKRRKRLISVRLRRGSTAI